MQELRFVAVSEDGSYAVLAVPGRSARFTLPIDERLRAVALGQTSRLAQYEIEVESPLRPKEIQARIRAGETAEEIADAAGLPVERVRWFEGPVLAERAYIASQAQTASVRRQGDSAPGPRLGDIVPDRISALGADPQDAEWDSRKRGDGNWQVSLAFPNGGRLHVAEWVFDPRRRHVMPADEAAERLCLPESELPPLPASIPGEATVTPLAPRLGAVAGGGIGPVGGGGHGGTGYGGNAPGGYGPAGAGNSTARFRPDRPAADRAGMDRPYADRAQERPAADRAPAYDRHPGYDRPAPDRYAPESYERPAPDRHPGYDQPASYGPQPPASYAQPADSTPSSHPVPPSRPPQPPAHTLSPGHGLVPMWDPPAWNPEPEPEPEPGRAPAPVPPAGRAAPREDLYAERDGDDELPSPGWAEQDRGQGGPASPAGLAFEDPEPVLAKPGPAAQPPEDRMTSSRADSTARADLAPPRPVPAAEPKRAEQAARPGPAEAAAVPLAEPVAAERVMAPAEDAPAKAAPAQGTQAEDRGPGAGPAATPAAAAEAAEPKPTAPAKPTAGPADAAEGGAAQPTVAEALADEAPAVAEAPKVPEQAAAEPAEAPEQQAADEQQARPRAAKGPKAKGRRSSVPSWDEIMLGSSRQRD